MKYDNDLIFWPVQVSSKSKFGDNVWHTQGTFAIVVVVVTVVVVVVVVGVWPLTRRGRS